MQKNNNIHIPKAQGFTLIEILLVIGIIAVLATVVIVALDPAKRFADARNARRLSDIESILSATQQYIVDNKGELPPGFADGYERQLGTASTGCELTNGPCSANLSYCLDLSASLAKYLKNLPYDPAVGSSERTQYSIQVNENNIITIRSCNSTDETISSVSR